MKPQWVKWWNKKKQCWVLEESKFSYGNDEYQRDVWEYIDEMSLGGERFDPFALGVQSQIGKKQ